MWLLRAFTSTQRTISDSVRLSTEVLANDIFQLLQRLRAFLWSHLVLVIVDCQTKETSTKVNIIDCT